MKVIGVVEEEDSVSKVTYDLDDLIKTIKTREDDIDAECYLSIMDIIAASIFRNSGIVSRRRAKAQLDMKGN